MSKKQCNILFIMADQWHHLDFGYRDHPVVRTPNLDRLQSESIDFTHAYAQNAFCLPSRASILSGQYLRTHREYGFWGILPEDVPCLPELLRENGYHTFHVGKHHCNPFGDRLGFDEFVPTLPEDMCHATDLDVNYMAWSREQGIGYPNDQVHGDNYCAVYPPSPLELGGTRLNMYGTSEIPLEKSIERYTSDRAIEFLQRAPDDKPFYLSVSFDRPHGPWSPSPEDVAMYNPAEIPLPDGLTEEDLELMPEHIVKYVRGSKTGVEKTGEEGMRTILALYYALITRVDAEMGRVIDALESRGYAEETAIVFCTDHGDMAGNLGLFDKYSNTIYHDDIIRTPLLLRPPGPRVAGRRVQQSVELIDIFPTLLDIVGLDAGDLPIEGKNLLSLATDDDPPWGGVAFSESYGIKTVIKDGWKLIYYVNSEEGELYDLRNDSRERRNLYRDPQRQVKKIELLRELVGFFTPEPSERRQAFIRSLFDDSELTPRRIKGKLFKWNKGIVEGDGFWMSFRDDYRLTAIPFDDIFRLEKLDEANPTDGVVRNYTVAEEPDRMEAMLGRLIDYIAGKIRPISLLTGSETEQEDMRFCRGPGLC